MAEERPTLEPIQREWYSVTEVALRLGISERRVWKMLKAKELTAHRMRQKLVRIARAQGYVTIDDVRRPANVPAGQTNGQNWIGSVFKDKRFLWTGRMKKSEIPSNHGRMIRVWSLRGQ